MTTRPSPTAAPDGDHDAGRRPLDVDVLTETFVDTSRPTPAGAETPASDARTLVTRIAHPTSGGPYPLVVLSHGLTGHPDEFTDTVPAWAADGFVVASPAFPLTNREVPGAGSNVADVVNQPGDVSFVIDQVLAANDDPASELYGLVDPEAIGVVGHSLGGATTWAVSFNTATRDTADRLDGDLRRPDPRHARWPVRAGLRPAAPRVARRRRPDPARQRPRGLRAGDPPKWFVTLLGGDHVPPFTDIPSVHDESSPIPCSTSGTAPSTATPTPSPASPTPPPTRR